MKEPEKTYFLVKDNVFNHPSQLSVLPSRHNPKFHHHIGRRCGVTVKEEPVPREMLYLADETFLTGTAAEITPIRTVDQIPVGKGDRGEVTNKLQDEFFSITKGRDEDQYNWLTFLDLTLK